MFAKSYTSVNGHPQKVPLAGTVIRKQLVDSCALSDKSHCLGSTKCSVNASIEINVLKLPIRGIEGMIEG